MLINNHFIFHICFEFDSHWKAFKNDVLYNFTQYENTNLRLAQTIIIFACHKILGCFIIDIKKIVFFQWHHLVTKYFTYF